MFKLLTGLFLGLHLGAWGYYSYACSDEGYDDITRKHNREKNRNKFEA